MDKPSVKSTAREWLAKFCTGTGLDIGCGCQKVIDSAIGIDILRNDPSCVADYFMDAQHLDFPDNSFDYITSSLTLEHFPDTKAVLKEWHRVLAPNGILSLCVPDAHLNPASINDEFHYVGFTDTTLLAFLDFAGFHPISFLHMDSEDFPCLLIAAKKVHEFAHAMIPDSKRELTWEMMRSIAG